MSNDKGESDISLESYPTWLIAVVFAFFVAISFGVDRIHLYSVRIYRIIKKSKKTIDIALRKISKELKLLGFFSLLMLVLRPVFKKIRVTPDVYRHMLPCSPEHKEFSKGKVPMFSAEVMDQIHVFVFFLVAVHIASSTLTVVIGSTRIRRWENSISKNNSNEPRVWKQKFVKVWKQKFVKVLEPKLTDVQQSQFIKGHFNRLLGWLQSLFKQFYSPVTKSDYMGLKLGFFLSHCKSSPRFDFPAYMTRVLDDYFKQVVDIRWYHFGYVAIFLALNVHGWNTYFWVAFVPVFLLLALGTNLEHIVILLALEVAEKHADIELNLVIQPSDKHFWFHRPQNYLFLIHFVLFQNAFEIAFLLWILVTTYEFDNCIMGKFRYIVPRLVIGGFIQLLCGYSTLPLYAIAAQMGTDFKKEIFDELVGSTTAGTVHVQEASSSAGNEHVQEASTSAGNERVQEGSRNEHVQEGSMSAGTEHVQEGSTSAGIELVQEGSTSAGIELEPFFPDMNDMSHYYYYEGMI